jgi:tetratricopeptide (TPR) repeat protein
MRIWGIAAAVALALTSFGAENVAPTKSELEEMYNKAFRDFEANNFPQALKELDAIDARQPDVAASQNLRGVILMRQGIYDKAEAALLEADRLDPKFWNARFNLAEIPFLQKDWSEARNRFQKLLSSSQSDLAPEATQLIQYKILLTYLLEGQENTVDSILTKLELSPNTPAVDYAKAAVALQHKNEKEAKDWIAVAAKKFSPQLNKQFVESFYEVGWLERSSGEGRASLPLMTAAERKEKAKATADAKFEQTQHALRQRDLATARKLIDEADQVEPNQAATLNLRGEILVQQKEFDQAEAAFKKAAKLDPKFREAQYNLAQVPFKKRDYAKARERFEALFEQTPDGDKNQAAELIRFKIYMTLLLEGKESRAQSMMKQFQFTGDTPALYYAEAAWEFKHSNGEKAADWVASAKKIYSQALNSIFADDLYDVGWIQAPEVAAVPAFDAGSLIASQSAVGSAPAIEPSPIPDSGAAANKQEETAKTERLASASALNLASTGVEATAGQSAVSASAESPAGGTVGPRAQTSSAAESAGAAASPAEAVDASPVSTGKAEQSPVAATKPSRIAISKAPTKTIASGSRIGVTGLGTSSRTWLVGALLLAGIFLLAWAIVPRLSRRYAFGVSRLWQARSFLRPRSLKPAASTEKGTAPGSGLLGGPRQVSLRLTASKPSLRRTALPLGKSTGIFDRRVNVLRQQAQGTTYDKTELDRGFEPATELEPVFESSVGRVVEQAPQMPSPFIPEGPTMAEASAADDSSVITEQMAEESAHTPERTEKPEIMPEVSPEPEFGLTGQEEPPLAEAITQIEPPAAEPISVSTPAVEPIQEEFPGSYEPVGQIEASIPEAIANPAAPDFATSLSTEPVFPKTTTPAAMPETTPTPTAPVTKPSPPSPTSAAKPQPATVMSVQVTFSFEIAAVQLTSSFKMGVLKVRPASKLVTMRLAHFQESQPVTNSEVAFEIAKVELVGDALDRIEVVPSRQEKPMAGGSPSFATAALQFVPDLEAAPIWLTPSQQGQASVRVTAAFQITMIEFSPSLESSSIILNSNSKQVIIQLPGAPSSLAEAAPVFEIANVQLSESGDNIGMMQLNLLGPGQKRA